MVSPFAQRLRRLRKRYLLSPRQLGDRAGLSARCIRNIESGRRQPSLDTTSILYDVLVVLGKNFRRVCALLDDPHSGVWSKPEPLKPGEKPWGIPYWVKGKQ